MFVLMLMGSNVVEDGNASTPSDLIWHSTTEETLWEYSDFKSRSPPSGTHNGSDAPSSNENNGKKLAIRDIFVISLGYPFFIALIDLVLILFCRKGKRDEHVTRPSIVNPPFSSEKVNAENRYSRSKWWPWVNAGYQG
ncbi:hypothetical protein Tco_1304590 [Tanacetum coccineum]